MTGIKHYEEDYFNWQKNIGAFGGKANLFKFSDFINKNDRVIDFGSGGGFLLANIDCHEKIGIEINPTAREKANELGINTVSMIDEIMDGWADVIISNHALEHTQNPLLELKRLHPKLKGNGKIIFVVPYERKNRYRADDINFHLFTWSEMNLGNLFTLAGYNVLEVTEILHKWPPHFIRIRKIFGNTTFNLICKIYGRINNNISQVRIIARKSDEGKI